MAESPLYSGGGGTGDNVNVTDDPGRQLGIVSTSGEVAVVSDSALDVSGAKVTIEDDGAFSVASMPDLGILDSSDSVIDPATEDTLSSELSREIATWSAGTIPATQSGDWSVGVEDSTGSAVDPAESGPQGNWPNLNQFTYSTGGTTAEALDANAVPDGVTVLVEYQQGNTGDVFVGDDTTQQSPLTDVGQGRTFNVEDTSSVYVRTPNSGDGVVVTFEVN